MKTEELLDIAAAILQERFDGQPESKLSASEFWRNLIPASLPTFDDRDKAIAWLGEFRAAAVAEFNRLDELRRRPLRR